MSKEILIIIFSTGLLHSYGQKIKVWQYNVLTNVQVPSCPGIYCFECCNTSPNFLLTPGKIKHSVDCPSGQKVYSIKDQERNDRCIVINDSLFKKKYITEQLMYTTMNFGLQWNDFTNSPVPYLDIMYGAYANIVDLKKITIPVGIRTGLGFIAKNKFPLILKAEILTGFYSKKLESFISVNLGYMKSENLKSGFSPYLSVGVSKLFLHERTN